MAVDLVFDLDGTLTDPAEGIVKCLNYALSEHGYGVRQADELTRYIGPPLDESFRLLLQLRESEAVDNLIATYRVRYARVGYSENVLYDGILEALKELRAAGFTLGVCTSKRVDFAEQILELFSLRQYFEFVHGGEVGVSKDQQLAELMEQGHVDQNSTMIGDRRFDVAAAKSNGLRSAGVLYGYGALKELEAAAPDWFIPTPRDIATTFRGR
jgi:phosphoglycolate phosphatase